MMNILKKYIFGLFIVTLLFSCKNSYNRLLKSNDYAKKYEESLKYYQKKNYDKALALLEELISVYRGTDKAEKISYYIAYANFHLGNFELASFYFKNFVRTFPSSGLAEECGYMTAYCFYLTSPVYSLDQSDTRSAIKEFQAFIDQYPASDSVKTANFMIDRLRGKLEKKDYEIAMQYYNLADYKAAIVGFSNLPKDFPNTRYKEEAFYRIAKASYLLAIKSIESKKLERLNATMSACLSFENMFPQSSYQQELNSIYKSASRQKEKFLTTNKSS